MADAVADSLKLSQAAAKTDADVIVFCGVHFMAETAAILLPEKTVLLPDLRAGCSLAASITPEELRKWKAKLPGAVVVAYINTSAAVKAESDYCCTSANAAKVVSAIPADRPILFLPDKFLADGRRATNGTQQHRRVSRILPRSQDDSPRAGVEIMDGASRYRAAVASRMRLRQLLHGEGGRRHAAARTARSSFRPKACCGTSANLPATEFAVGTELGIMHQLNKKFPEKTFYPVNSNAVCAFMKTITLDKVIRSLETLTPQIRVPEDIARKAKRAIDRMLELA